MFSKLPYRSGLPVTGESFPSHYCDGAPATVLLLSQLCMSSRSWWLLSIPGPGLPFALCRRGICLAGFRPCWQRSFLCVSFNFGNTGDFVGCSYKSVQWLQVGFYRYLLTKKFGELLVNEEMFSCCTCMLVQCVTGNDQFTYQGQYKTVLAGCRYCTLK